MRYGDSQVLLVSAYGRPKKQRVVGCQTFLEEFLSKSVGLTRTSSEGAVVALPSLRQSGASAHRASAGSGPVRARQLAASLSDSQVGPVGHFLPPLGDPTVQRAQRPRLRKSLKSSFQGSSHESSLSQVENDASLKILASRQPDESSPSRAPVSHESRQAAAEGVSTRAPQPQPQPRRRHLVRAAPELPLVERTLPPKGGKVFINAQRNYMPPKEEIAGREVPFTAHRQDTPPKEESSSLQEISSVASRIYSDLDWVRQNCGAPLENIAAFDGERKALQEISSVTQQVCDDLSLSGKDGEPAQESFRQVHAVPQNDDPVTEKTEDGKIASATQDICEKMGTSCRQVGIGRPASALDSLLAISVATQRVCEDMQGILTQGWAAEVLAAVPARPEGFGAAGEDLQLPNASSLRTKPHSKTDGQSQADHGAKGEPCRATVRWQTAEGEEEEESPRPVGEAPSQTRAQRGPEFSTPSVIIEEQQDEEDDDDDDDYSDAMESYSEDHASRSGSLIMNSEAKRTKEAIPADDSEPAVVKAPSKDLRATTLTQSKIIFAKMLRRGTDIKFDAVAFGAFNRYKILGQSEMHVDDLPELLLYLGHVRVNDEKVREVVGTITEYDYLDFEEFLKFREAFVQIEREFFQEKVREFDADGNGGISVAGELRSLMCSIGFLPCQATIEESLQAVTMDDDGMLDFTELAFFLAVYCHSEGFSQSATDELQGIFDALQHSSHGDTVSSQSTIPEENICEGFVRYFGMHIEELATKQMGAGFKSAYAKQKHHDLTFQEFLIFARKIRETDFEQFQEDYDSRRGVFHKLDQGHDRTSFSDADIRNILANLGYTPLSQNIREMCGEVRPCDDDPWNDTCKLDFTQLFEFVSIARKRDGFMTAALEDMKTVFVSYDVDNTGDISTLELADCFRQMGYHLALEEIRAYILRVDHDNTNTLDFREFLRVMRLHREKALRHYRSKFDDFLDKESDFLPKHRMEEALVALGFDRENVRAVTVGYDRAKMSGSSIDFDGFVQVSDAVRKYTVSKEARQCGFSEAEIAELKISFDQFDTDKSGEIDTMELDKILKLFGWEPKTREQQQGLMVKLNEARAAARKAGVTDVGQDNSSRIRFWSFVQLARRLHNEQDAAEEDFMKAIAQEFKFTMPEAHEFRQIFEHWHHREVGRRRGSFTGALLPLPVDVTKRLVGSLGAIPREKVRSLDQQLESLQTNHNGGIEFHRFLELMRWLLDTDFMGGNGAGKQK